VSDPIEIRWLGQAGYSITASDGAVCWIDPYLSDLVEHELGMARIVPAPVDPRVERVDVVVITHWHQDHLDIPTCLTIAEASPGTVFVSPPSCVARLAGRGLHRERLRELVRGTRVQADPFLLRATFARHEVPGWLTEDAVGLVVETGQRRIFHSGDTEYDGRCLEARAYGPFDVGMFVGNGSGGNMTMREAALMAHELQPRLAVPAHYGMWSNATYGLTATLDPTEFVDYCARLGGPPTVVLDHGVSVQIGGDGLITSPPPEDC
jgi:L-ascorbate 6-phosphate lactonase